MTYRAISPLCRRMIEDMTVRGFTACTQQGCISAVMTFTAFPESYHRRVAELIPLSRSALIDRPRPTSQKQG